MVVPKIIYWACRGRRKKTRDALTMLSDGGDGQKLDKLAYSSTWNENERFCFFKIYLFLLEKESACVVGRGTWRGREKLRQTLC